MNGEGFCRLFKQTCVLRIRKLLSKSLHVRGVLLPLKRQCLLFLVENRLLAWNKEDDATKKTPLGLSREPDTHTANGSGEWGEKGGVHTETREIKKQHQNFHSALPDVEKIVEMLQTLWSWRPAQPWWWSCNFYTYNCTILANGVCAQHVSHLQNTFISNQSVRMPIRTTAPYSRFPVLSPLSKMLIIVKES